MSETSIAALFPGQGSQRVGMAGELYRASSAARAVLDEAERALPGLLTLMWEGPSEELQLTANQQPALVAAGAAAYAAWLEAGGRPAAAAAGHSLGEYTALVAAGALTVTDAVRLVRRRGVYMQEAVPEGEGAMAAVMRLSADEIKAALLELPPGEVAEIANLNSPEQTVISGSAAGVERASELLRERGGRTVPLRVSAPFHSSLMRPAAERLRADLAATRFSEPAFPVVCNVTAAPLEGALRAADLLEEQVTRSVRWVECVNYLSQFGAARFIEFGSGKVLTGLIARILPGANATWVDSPASLEAALGGTES